MIKLISEGLFTDGSFQLSKVLEQTNDRLGKLGKHGKRAKLKQSKNSIVLQFSFEAIVLKMNELVCRVEVQVSLVI